MRKKSVAVMVRQINSAKARIAAERDNLRDLADELEAIVEDCDEAETGLTAAADALSRYV